MKIKSMYMYYYKELLFIIKNSKKLLGEIFLLKFMLTIVALLPPLVYKYYINRVIAELQLNRMLYVIFGYVVLYVIQSLFLVFIRFVENQLNNVLKLDLKNRLLNIYTSMYYVDYEKYSIGDIKLRIESDTDVICTFYIEHILNPIFSFVGSVIMIVLILQLNWQLTLFGLIMIAISLYISKVLAEKIKRVSSKFRTDQSEFEGVIHEALQNWKEIKINNLEKKEEELLKQKWNALSKSVLKRTKYEYLHGALIAINLFFVTRMNLYFFGGILIISKLLTVPSMLVFMNYYEQLYSNIQTILDSIVNLSSQSPKIDAVLSVLKYVDEYNVEEQTNVDLNQKIAQGNICLDHISFQYPSSIDYVLHDVSTTFQKNHSVAIVGESGCGKTTLVKLLVGLYLPNHGAIYLDDINLNRIPLETRSQIINIVMQDPMLFNMSIRDNLLMVKPNAAQEEIDDVCKKANIYEFIQSTPEKYNTVIGEQGIKLSGGQKQRLAIARTLLINPLILIIDEATSSLDSENESSIVKSIYDLAEDKTIITISHKYSTISKSDDIVIIQDGTIKEQGKLKNIVSESELFTSIFRKENIATKMTGSN